MGFEFPKDRNEVRCWCENVVKLARRTLVGLDLRQYEAWDLA
jgi:hypothetical protein